MTDDLREGSKWIGVLLVLSILISLGLTAAANPGDKEDKRGISTLPRQGAVSLSGNYWALIIGIDSYQSWPRLRTGVHDAEAVRDVLISRYGFERHRIIELTDMTKPATRIAIIHALFDLKHQAQSSDSILIYYAGHGQYDESGELGWWVPKDAELTEPATFISNAEIRDVLRAMKAKHVYLVSDSCFSGSLLASRGAVPVTNARVIKELYAKRSRWALTSGGTQPVADEGAGGHSIFAYYFLKILTENSNPFLIPYDISGQIVALVGNNSEQTPRSGPIFGALDEQGQFVFRLSDPLKNGGSPVQSDGMDKELRDLAEREKVLTSPFPPTSDRKSSLQGQDKILIPRPSDPKLLPAWEQMMQRQTQFENDMKELQSKIEGQSHKSVQVPEQSQVTESNIRQENSESKSGSIFDLPNDKAVRLQATYENRHILDFPSSEGGCSSCAKDVRRRLIFRQDGTFTEVVEEARLDSRRRGAGRQLIGQNTFAGSYSIVSSDTSTTGELNYTSGGRQKAHFNVPLRYKGGWPPAVIAFARTGRLDDKWTLVNE